MSIKHRRLGYSNHERFFEIWFYSETENEISEIEAFARLDIEETEVLKELHEALGEWLKEGK